MVELRLVPLATLVWAVTLCGVLRYGFWVSFSIVLLGVGLALLCRHPGQALLLGGGGLGALCIVMIRLHLIAQFHFPRVLRGTMAHNPRDIGFGNWLVNIQVPGHPGQLRVLCHSDVLPDDLVTGADIAARVTMGPASRAGLAEYQAKSSSCVVEHPPTGIARWVAQARDVFIQSVAEHSDGPGRGLIPGMVMGDTSLQSPEDVELYIETGISHLSAVSGANVAIICTTALLLLRAMKLGLRAQLCGATLALLAFVLFVGTEPSVLRASVTGVVGLLAVLRSARMEPIHALCIAVIGLVLWDSDLAVSYGFALSVAATAGIIALSPLLIRFLAPLGLAHILTSALAVAISADLVTMPIIALMAGKVSVVGVLTNILVTTVVPLITMCGLIAALCSLIPGDIERFFFFLMEPATWWIHHCAVWCRSYPWAVITVPEGLLGVAWVIVVYGWFIYWLATRRFVFLGIVLGLFIVAPWWL